MWSHTPPLRDMQFVIEDMLLAPAAWPEMPACAELDGDGALSADPAGRTA